MNKSTGQGHSLLLTARQLNGKVIESIAESNPKRALELAEAGAPILARVVELLFTDGAPEVDLFVLGTSDDTAARIAGVVRERFQKKVVGIGVEGVTCDGLQAALDGYEPLPMPAIMPAMCVPWP